MLLSILLDFVIKKHTEKLKIGVEQSVVSMNAFMIGIIRELLDLPLYITLGHSFLEFTCLEITSASNETDSQ